MNWVHEYYSPGLSRIINQSDYQIIVKDIPQKKTVKETDTYTLMISNKLEQKPLKT